MKKSLKLSLTLLSFIVLSGCGYFGGSSTTVGSRSHKVLSPQEKASLSYSTVNALVFSPKCIRCHGSSGGVSLQSYEQVKQNISAIDRAVFANKSMPKGESLSENQLAVLQAWIEMGAPEKAGSPAPNPTPTPVPTPPQPIPSQVYYNDVRDRVFAVSCVRCHSGQKAAGGVRLDSFAAIKANINDIKKTTLIKKTMPKNSSLTKDQYDVLSRWIEQGSPENAQPSTPTPTPAPTATPLPLEAKFDSIKQNILNKRCLYCHSGQGQAKHIPLSTIDDLVKSPREIALPGNPDESGIVIAIERQDEKRMPPPKEGAALTPDEIRVIREWIQKGAKD